MYIAMTLSFHHGSSDCDNEVDTKGIVKITI